VGCVVVTLCVVDAAVVVEPSGCDAVVVVVVGSGLPPVADVVVLAEPPASVEVVGPPACVEVVGPPACVEVVGAGD
jgi:hypothetical protein